LADLYLKYDPTIVLEFYTYAWTEGPNDMKAKVKGRWIHCDRNAINQFLENALLDDVECIYQTLKVSRDGFSEMTIVQKLCIPNRSFQLGVIGNSLRIKR